MLIKTFLRYFILFQLFFIFITSSVLHAQAADTSFKWQKGEELIYGVDWAFVRLGTVRVSNLGKVNINGHNANHIKLVIESNPLLFWLNNQSVYNSYVTDSMRIVRFVSDEKVDGTLYNAQYDFDYTNDVLSLTLFDKENPDSTQHKTLPMEKDLIDGVSLIYYARANVHNVKRDTILTFMEDNKGDILFNFAGKREDVEIDSLQNPIDAFYFDGEILIEGIAGVTGPYESWFSTDEQHVPLLSYMEVFIGNVKIELEQWKNWTPRF